MPTVGHLRKCYTVLTMGDAEEEVGNSNFVFCSEAGAILLAAFRFIRFREQCRGHLTSVNFRLRLSRLCT